MAANGDDAALAAVEAELLRSLERVRASRKSAASPLRPGGRALGTTSMSAPPHCAPPDVDAGIVSPVSDDSDVMSLFAPL